MNQSWSIYGIWNKSILQSHENRVNKPRDYMYASELNSSYIDRYLKMKGETYTNPPNPRSLRKFEAGNIWENIIEIVLKRAGIYVDSQVSTKFAINGCVPVSGRLDHLAGGNIDWEKAKSTVMNEFEWLPDGVKLATSNIVDELSLKYPDGMKKLILEIKSTSSFMFEQYEKNNKPSPNHRLQLYHYLKGLDMDEGHIVYICKDDCRMIEIPIFRPSEVEDEYTNDVRTMSNYWINQEQPPIEKLLVYDQDFDKFSANWKVMYSNYLTKLYGFENQMEYEELYRPIAEKFNRVYKRIKEGKKMTKGNDEIIEESLKLGYDMKKIAYDHRNN